MADADALRTEWEDHLQVTAAAAALLPSIERLAAALVSALGAGGKLLIFGNGGSAADAQHFAGELLGRFRDARRPLPAVALTTDPSVETCIANDFSYNDLLA